MTDIPIAIVLHVLGVVWWVGGLALVTTVVLPQLRRNPVGTLERFHAVERRFAPQVRTAVAIVGASGGWLLYRCCLTAVTISRYCIEGIAIHCQVWHSRRLDNVHLNP